MDILIRNGKVIDGTGNPWKYADIGVEKGKIVFVGKAKSMKAKREINAEGMYISPGFIDIHAHYDFAPLISNTMEEKLFQGVTTLLVGHCGYSAAPICLEKADLLDKYVSFFTSGSSPDYKWNTMGNYLKFVEQLGVGANFAALVGQGTLRIDTMGFDSRKPTLSEMSQMKKRLQQSMDEGAFGLSTGLVYPPGSYTDKEELIELVSVIKPYDGIFTSHIRGEGDTLIEAIQEMIDIVEVTQVQGQINHLKVIGKSNWGKSTHAVEMISKARDRGLDITADQYPYTYGSTTLRAFLPSWVQSGGVDELCKLICDSEIRRRIINQIEEDDSWDNIYLQCGSSDNVTVVYSPELPQYTGMNLTEIGQKMNKSPVDVNGHLKTGTFGHEKSSTKSWKLIPPLHQSDLVEPNGCEFGSCHRAG